MDTKPIEELLEQIRNRIEDIDDDPAYTRAGLKNVYTRRRLNEERFHLAEAARHLDVALGELEEAAASNRRYLTSLLHLLVCCREIGDDGRV